MCLQMIKKKTRDDLLNTWLLLEPLMKQSHIAHSACPVCARSHTPTIHCPLLPLHSADLRAYLRTCLTMRTALTFHSILVRVMGMRRRMLRKVSWLMLLYMSSKPLCRILSWVCATYIHKTSEQKNIKYAMSSTDGTHLDKPDDLRTEITLSAEIKGVLGHVLARLQLQVAVLEVVHVELRRRHSVGEEQREQNASERVP